MQPLVTPGDAFLFRQIIFRPKKTGEHPTVIPLPPDTPTGEPDELRRWLEDHGGLPEALVFTRPNGATVADQHVRHAIDDAREIARTADGAAAIRAELSPIALRRSFGSWLAMEGVSLYVIQRLLGHKRVEITARHYGHMAPAGKASRDAVG